MSSKEKIIALCNNVGKSLQHKTAKKSQDPQERFSSISALTFSGLGKHCSHFSHYGFVQGS